MVAEIKSSDGLLSDDALKGEDSSDCSDYSEDSLVEKSAILEFEKLGYTHLNCFHEKVRA